jgi:hypothetical protein
MPEEESAFAARPALLDVAEAAEVLHPIGLGVADGRPFVAGRHAGDRD